MDSTTSGLSVLPFYRSALAITVLAVTGLAPIGFGIWKLLDFQGARDWENAHGPVALALIVILGAAFAVAGLSRPSPSALLMVTVTVVPWVLSILGARSEWRFALIVGLISSPVTLGGGLDLWAGRPGHARAPRGCDPHVRSAR